MRKGFTLIEMMVVIGIIAALGVAAGLNLFGKKSGGDITDTTQSIGAVLREAQSDSVAQSQDAQWGVHFDNTNPAEPYYALFYTTNGSYSGATISSHYNLPADLCYASSTIAQGSSVNIIFNSISGAPTSGTSTSIGLQVGGCGTASTTTGTPTLTRTGTGEIFFDNFGRTNL
jgi:prepilin-type N-terminal cleavage/methylation domain-containing protein